MGNEVSRPAEDLSPQSSGAVPARSPYTPTGGAARRAQSFNSSPSPSPQPVQRRSSSSASLAGANPSAVNPSNPRKERTIQRMDKAIRRRVRGGITYNMKLLLRGARGTGKTSLFQRLQGQPIPETHQSTPQLQSAAINWSFRQNLEENVRCEVWDVVDRGFVPVDAEGDAEDGPAASQGAARAPSAEHGGLQGGGSLSADAAAAAAAAAAAMQNGTHSVAIVDASTVDVYHEAHGVIFLLDVTRWDTLEYVKQQLDSVPVHIPTLVLGNFRDQGAQRKIFKEDIEELLYGSSDRPQHQQWRRPTELLYFECSLLNCYGLKSLHQYFGIPFLQLKLATIRQQMRIVEGEFAHLKHDVQATISEQRYAEYVEHIKATGSDIRTGRRGSGNGNTPPAVSRTDSVRISPRASNQATPATQQEGADDDVSVVNKRDGAGTPPKPAPEATTTTTESTSAQQAQELPQPVDAEDLPARNSKAVIQAAPPLKFEHKESVTSIPDSVVEAASMSIEEKPVSPERRNGDTSAAVKASPSPRKASVEEVMHLEDFQVPKARMSDLDHFYSEDESDEDAGDYDEDVVVAPVDGAMKASIGGVYHKQRFLDSDSDSDDNETRTQSRRKANVSRKKSPRNIATKQASSTGQQMPRPPTSSAPSPPSPHPPKSLSRPTQRSRTGSPVRPQPSSPAKDALGTSRGASQHQSPSPTSATGGPVAPTPPASPPTSPLASSIRHSSPRHKTENTTAAVKPEMIQAVSPPRRVENEMHLGVSSGEEPELAGTEDAVVPTHEQVTTEVSTQESAKQFSNDADASSEPDDTTSAFKENVMEASNAAPTTTEENSLEDSTLRTANTKHGADTKQELMDPSQGSIEDLSNVKETHKALVVGGGDDDEVGLDSNSNELKSFLEDDNDSGENDTSEALPEEDTVADEPVLQVAPACSPAIQRPDVVMSDDESDSNEDKKGGSTSLSLTSLQASLPIPEASPPSTSVAPPSVDAFNQENLLQGQGMGHYHKRNLEESGDLLSLSALQASLPMPGQSVVPLASIAHASGHNEGANEAAVHISDLQTTPSPAPVPDFSTVVPSNDLEAFLNESGSDSEDAAPPSYSEPPANQGKSGRRTVVVESSDDDEDEENDQDRFASYSISKKSRSERRRKQKEDLRQLNAALDKSSGWDGMENDPFTAPATGVAASEASFGTSDVMEAIRKAQEEAMRMLPAASAPVDDDADADSSSSKKRHKHKHKKEHKHKKRESEDGPKENSSKKSSRKSGSSSRSKKRRPHVEDDIE